MPCVKFACSLLGTDLDRHQQCLLELRPCSKGLCSMLSSLCSKALAMRSYLIKLISLPVLSRLVSTWLQISGSAHIWSILRYTSYHKSTLKAWQHARGF